MTERASTILERRDGLDLIAYLASLTPSDLATRLDRTGVTPLVPIELVGERGCHTVHLKLESEGPTGSVKDRTARALFDAHRDAGHLPPGAVLVESTSGNLGVALAALARAHELPFVAVVDPRTAPEILDKMRRLGADLDVVDAADDFGGYLGSRLRRAGELCDQLPGAVWTNQYAHNANPKAHATTTGPELLAQMDGRIDAVFVAVSTCGTLAGLGSFLRRHSPRTRIIAVDAVGSVVFGFPPASRLLVGIGASRTPDFDITGLYDHVVLVRDAEAFAVCRALDATGISVGGSSGAVIAACARYLNSAPELERIACLCPDGGDSYRSTIWNDDWLRSGGIDLAELRAPAEFARPTERG